MPFFAFIPEACLVSITVITLFITNRYTKNFNATFQSSRYISCIFICDFLDLDANVTFLRCIYLSISF